MSSFSIANILPSVSSLLLMVTSIALGLAYFYKKKYSYWAKRGVPYLKPVVLFGNTKNQLLQRVPMAIDLQRIYNELDGNKFAGIYVMTTPTLFLRDPETIRNFLIKSFSHFHDRRSYLNEKLDPLSPSLLNLTGQRWRNVRYKLVSPFSSAKLKLMHNLMNECIDELDGYLTKATSKNAAGSEQNLKALMSKLTTDVIGSCALGLRCNSIQDENSKFYQIGRKVFQFSYRVIFRNILKPVCPKLIDIFRLKVFSQDVDDFFMSVLRDSVKEREANSQKRNDFLQLLINIQAEEQEHLRSNGHSQENGDSPKSTTNSKIDPSNGANEQSPEPVFTDNVVAANAFLFFLAGFETTASTLTFILYELTLNPDIFDKVRAEVESAKEAHGGNLDYNALKKLVYMDMVISGGREEASFTISPDQELIQEASSLNANDVLCEDFPLLCQLPNVGFCKMAYVIKHDAGRLAGGKKSNYLESSSFTQQQIIWFRKNQVKRKVIESMRKYPAAPFFMRVCTETFKIPESSVIIEKGTPVIVPVYALHHDPKYFPEPDNFIPERFSKEKKDSIVLGSYLPFGDGPRICIGARFALFEIKAALSSIVSNYTLHPSDKTQVPLKFNVKSTLLSSEDGIWIKFRRREAAS